jgi:hypothetical protein
MSTILRVLGPEVSIASANTVGNAPLARVVNTGATALLTISHANGVSYATATVLGSTSVVIQKATTDRLAGANMVAAPIAYRN